MAGLLRGTSAFYIFRTGLDHQGLKVLVSDVAEWYEVLYGVAKARFSMQSDQEVVCSL